MCPQVSDPSHFFPPPSFLFPFLPPSSSPPCLWRICVASLSQVWTEKTLLRWSNTSLMCPQVSKYPRSLPPYFPFPFLPPSSSPPCLSRTCVACRSPVWMGKLCHHGQTLPRCVHFLPFLIYLFTWLDLMSSQGNLYTKIKFRFKTEDEPSSKFTLIANKMQLL